MRVAIDCCCWQNRRGLGRFTRELTTALVRRHGQRHRFVLLCDHETASSSTLPEGATTVSVVARRVESSDGARAVASLLRLGWALRRQRPDAVLFPSPLSYFPVLGRTPVVLCLHDAMTERQPGLFFASQRARWLWQAKLWLARGQAARIITPSEQARRDVAAAFDLSLASITLIGEGPAGCFVPLQDARRIAAVLRRHALDGARPLLLYVGSVSPHKNLEGLVSALAELRRDAHLAIVGPLAEESSLCCHDSLRALITRLGLGQRITFTGFVPDEDLVALYNAAAALVVPSFDEGFGLPALEAMACGTAVVVSARGALPALVGEAGICFDPLDRRSMAAAIRCLLEDERLRVDLGRRGRERARSHSWGRAADRTMAVLDELLDPASASRRPGKTNAAASA